MALHLMGVFMPAVLATKRNLGLEKKLSS
ncbi:hypothetical protein LINPERPRIM_LOCUS39241 [Linum perenne]